MPKLSFVDSVIKRGDGGHPRLDGRSNGNLGVWLIMISHLQTENPSTSNLIQSRFFQAQSFAASSHCSLLLVSMVTVCVK